MGQFEIGVKLEFSDFKTVINGTKKINNKAVFLGLYRAYIFCDNCFTGVSSWLW